MNAQLIDSLSRITCIKIKVKIVFIRYLSLWHFIRAVVKEGHYCGTGSNWQIGFYFDHPI